MIFITMYLENYKKKFYLIKNNNNSFVEFYIHSLIMKKEIQYLGPQTPRQRDVLVCKSSKLFQVKGGETLI